MKIVQLVMWWFISLASMACAEDLYTRPLSDCANNGNGTDYNCAVTPGAAGAYRGLGNVLFGTGAAKVSDGDTLFVCGMHDGGAADAVLAPTASATIDWNCPYDPGTILAAYIKFTSGWYGPDVFGVYSQNPVTGCPWHMAQMVDGVLVYLTKRTGVPDSTWKVGDWSQPGGCSTTYFVKPYAGLSANTVALYTNVNTIIDVVNVRVALKSPRIIGLTQDWAIKFTNADFSTVYNPVLKKCAQACIGIFNASDDVEILDGDISEAGNGIYAYSGTTAANSNRLIVMRNKIHDLDQKRFFSAFTDDAHAIGIQGGDDMVVVDNDMSHIPGSCITLYTAAGQSMKRNVIGNNHCEDVNDLSTLTKLNQDAYEIGSTNAGHVANDVVDNVITGNVALNVAGSCIKIKPSHATVGRDLKVTGNTLIHCGSALRFYDDEDGDAGFEYTHNRSLDSIRHIEHIQNGTDSLVNIKIDSNLYYTDGAGKFEWNGSITDFTAWKTNSGLDAHSVMSPVALE